jgi:hypothetical protein
MRLKAFLGASDAGLDAQTFKKSRTLVSYLLGSLSRRSLPQAQGWRVDMQMQASGAEL